MTSSSLILARAVALGVALASVSVPAPVEGQRTAGADVAPPTARALSRLAQGLDELREKWHVPGMTAAVAMGDEVVWERGFGVADRSTGRRADADTVYHLCSLTKPFAAAVLLQLVEQGRLSLDAPAADFGVALPRGVTVRHLLTHTSEGAPGEAYRYSGRRFGELDKVIATATGQTFAQAVTERILRPLGLDDTSPNPLVPEACVQAGRDPAVVARRLAQGYEPEGEDPVAYPARFLSAAGLVATARDMARFSMAWDDDRLLTSSSRTQAFAGARTSTGRVLPYGLGWFVQPRKPGMLVWHYGWWVGSSSLIVKMPDRRLTFVLLANSDGLSHEFDLGKDEDVLRSPFARAFVDMEAEVGGSTEVGSRK